MGEVHRLSDLGQESEAVFSPEAEQQVLGAIMLDNKRLSMVAQAGGVALFHEPFHAALYKHIAGMERDGILASPVTLREWAQAYPRSDDYGGAGYLVRMAGAAVLPGQIGDYVEHLAELSARRRIVAAVDEARARVLSGELPASHIAAQLEASILTVEGGKSARPVTMTEAARKAAEQAWAAHSGEETGAVPSGIGPLDRMVYGFRPGEMVLLGGRPSMGKTAVAINVALNAARAGRKVAFCSLEMGPDAIALRCMAESMAQQGRAITYRDLGAGNIPELAHGAFADALQEVAGLPIVFLPREYQDVGALMAGTKRARAMMKGLDLIIVDYVQLMKASQAKNRYEVITEISTAIKRLAGQMEVPILALSQLSRAVEQRDDKRPRMDDLRESGQLEQDADTILFCYRDEYYLEREPTEGLSFEDLESLEQQKQRARNRLEIIVAKQRQGPIGTANVFCNVAINRIWE